MQNENIPVIINESWHELLQPLFNDPKMIRIKDEVLPNCKFYPEASRIFQVFAMPIDKIKVVILGQDPYSKGEAIGYSFAVNPPTKIPPSLEIIRKEIINSKVERDSNTPIDSDRWRTLAGWRQQGVFLLNTALTVERLNPGSHSMIWEWFTNKVIKIISTQASPIWLLWGAKAKGYKSIIPTEKTVYILEADHPAAETYPGSKYKFSGCNHFNLCNKLLKSKHQNIINW